MLANIAIHLLTHLGSETKHEEPCEHPQPGHHHRDHEPRQDVPGRTFPLSHQEDPRAAQVQGRHSLLKISGFFKFHNNQNTHEK